MDSAKKNIRSILTSAGLSMTMRELEKDYVEFINESIPYRKHGFSHLEQFLRSMPDTVEVEGAGPYAIVHVTKSQKSSHVYDLVSKQRKNAPRKGERRNNKKFSKSTCETVLPVNEDKCMVGDELADVGELQKEVHRLNIRVSDLETKIGRLEWENQNLNADLKIQKACNETLQKFNACSEKQNTDFKTQIQELKIEIEVSDVSQSRMILQENHYLKDILEEMRESNKILKQNADLLTERMHRLEHKKNKRQT
ncbi:uncharacterized protein [Leptinotarsa decemlineata]|uniref:uncharacterized protein n=1 Tax=Leptinotarsa decemlineata TaxID=7539 RepID=UPI003D3045CB